MRLLWFTSRVLNSAGSTWWLEIYSVFAFHKWFRIMTGWRALERSERETILILFSCWLVLSGQLPPYPTLLRKRPSSHGEVVGSPWHHSRNFITNSALRGQEWWGRLRVKIPQEFLCDMCNLFKIKTESCVMPLLHHAAAGHILFLIDDAQCVGGREWEGGIWISSWIHHLSTLLLSPSLIPGDGEAAGGWEWNDDESGRSGEAAPSERQGPASDTGKLAAVVMQYSSACVASERLPFTSLCVAGDHFQMHVSKLLW